MSNFDNDISHDDAPTTDDDALYYEEQPEPDSDTPAKAPRPKPKSPFAIFLQTLGTPVEGWKELKRSKMKPDDFARGCFYPLLAVMAVCNFVGLFWMPDLGLKNVLIGAFSAFITLFLGYFIVVGLLINVMPRDCCPRLDSDFFRCFVMLALSSLSIVITLIECVPILQPILVFLPLYTIFIIIKGVRLLRCPENRSTLLATAISAAVIGIPLLIGWIIEYINPAQTV